MDAQTPPPAAPVVSDDPPLPELEQPASPVARVRPAHSAARRMGTPMRSPFRIQWFVPLTNELQWEIASQINALRPRFCHGYSPRTDPHRACAAARALTRREGVAPSGHHNDPGG